MNSSTIMDTKGLLCVPKNTQLGTKCLPARIFGKHINLGRNFHAKVPCKLQSESYTPKKVHITKFFSFLWRQSILSHERKYLFSFLSDST